MTVKGIERIKKFYPVWAIIAIVFLYFLLESDYSDFLLVIVILLLLKDVFIDLVMSRGSTPNWFEHAPFVILVSIVGLLDFFEVEPFTGLISPLTMFIAIVDSFIDVFDDMGFFG
ncbi:MAG: hypothetical protein Q6362_000700 [Candidatus Wukongarchaeota archaeon]|nr:hypothetical protein [Candidatus Wukongarchaeota archaeon]MDO8127961.1 hypothetical protein [Candidatus Wukongarchaeota archaeon]